mmetsp:Transcript_13225/g.35822  ORF Transcript_13225/g.35822 Transcript_13225/m.35822 type:complete len:260 (+) Transcript_13225:1484-2263(+)
MLKLCLVFDSAFRRSDSSFSALALRSSSTSMMPLLCDLYAAGSGAPASSSSDWSCACTNATRVFLSAVATPAASTMELRAPTRFVMLEASTCMKAAGFLAISFSMMPIARVTASTVSTSSASASSNSFASFSRTRVASLSSSSAFAIFPARSSIAPSDASMSLAAFSMVAFSSSTLVLAVLMTYCCCFVVSSHHSSYSTKALSSASPSLVNFAANESKSSMTLPSGLATARSSVAKAPVARRTRPKAGNAAESCIARCP